MTDDVLTRRLARWSIPEPNSGCLLWLGAVNRAGYGVATKDGRSRLAHRLSYECSNGQIPEGMHVCHKCDVPSCVNPDHLFLGTAKDNMADCKAKGRADRGTSRWNAKLTPEIVRQIRASEVGPCQAGRDFGIDESLVRQVRRGEIWRHVDG